MWLCFGCLGTWSRVTCCWNRGMTRLSQPVSRIRPDYCRPSRTRWAFVLHTLIDIYNLCLIIPFVALDHCVYMWWKPLTFTANQESSQRVNVSSDCGFGFYKTWEFASHPGIQHLEHPVVKPSWSVGPGLKADYSFITGISIFAFLWDDKRREKKSRNA